MSNLCFLYLFFNIDTALVNSSSDISVLENYLDGALADYEQGMVDNDELIRSSIRAIKTLETRQGNIICAIYNEYEDRYLKAKGEKE